MPKRDAVPPDFNPAVIFYDEIGSTNAEAMRLALGGDPGPLWVAARRQTAGRGRSGRSWSSESGNLFASHLFSSLCDVSSAHQVSLLAGVAAHDALVLANRSNPIAGLRVKWPNDVLIGTAKLAGILLESVVGSDGRLRIVVGIGINLAWHPRDLGRAATCLAEQGVDIAPESMLRHLAWAMQHWLAIWQDGAKFGVVREAWLQRAGPIGEAVGVNTGSGRLDGQFAGLAVDGALLLATGNGQTERVTFGDVTILAEAGDKTRDRD